MTNEQIVSIVEELDMQSSLIDYLVDFNGSAAAGFSDWYNDTLLSDIDTDQEKVIALMEEADFTYDEALKKIDDTDYLVLTDEEADEAWDEGLDSYLDECVIPELPESAQRYYDRDAWKSDARMDGRGHVLSTYNGYEAERYINDTTYYIYRCN